MITKHVSDTAGVPWGHRPTLRPAATATQGQAGSAPRLRVSPGLRREVGPASHPTACHFQRVLLSLPAVLLLPGGDRQEGPRLTCRLPWRRETHACFLN